MHKVLVFSVDFISMYSFILLAFKLLLLVHVPIKAAPK
jgi:hypothetical protein